MTTDDHLADLHAMWRIRVLEEKILELRLAGDVVGSVHLSNGQEAVAVGVCGQLRKQDAVFATYRGHGWAMARGVPAFPILAEVLARTAGVNGGRGGSAHFSAPEYGFYGENSIVGAGAPIATGAALASTFDKSGRVVVTVFGDGAMNQGAVPEAMNFAAAMNLPVIFVCENNKYSELTPINDMVRNPDLSARATALGIPATRVDGNDAAEVAAATALAIQTARHGLGPTFIEAHTRRIVGHYIGDAQQYRPEGELEADLAAEPIVRLSHQLIASGVAADTVDAARRRAVTEIEEAARRALAASAADPATALEHLYA
ncbi:acetoin:2,6-dichlorophenolindophenol oxidoreductase subunit alpha [Asanoa ishikariensis]|uniref:Pyruvate dehydrogenase E1 component alpha subunit/2-oxoisovalerate dehydrogenase E1 component n=1 Tax=Asanoa ishikariensis TaxID=137265 RepID=A0A1H3UDP6_9ACTN|nr:thiamine pyrophosphate-dependent dehydrogenase E1 component subunit alpha [Asanoa ishikariensis]GIF63874.1 acetoin:2,6-dichlorophenolindophenol oxidoreductase subunit alpha [Asanoa ishikariensis]SDZ59975.1 pyruvate dehydrogenase E1 component alpha subunit/2-oxoisovalerate dehydrogenase E1 component [Asanoa ishikariensis]